ncbi:MAG: hypothetical protein GY791_08315 [Alphaproteobacteria bacterium]|nr:hypothetical protein [Alphaproteobacteria bacterium]
MKTGKRWVYTASALTFVVYVAWLLGPYLRSTVVRDSAVTTWSRVAVAPIAGRIVTELPAVGDLVSGDGWIATIQNDLLLQDVAMVEATRDRMMLAEARIAGAEDYLADLEALDRARIAARGRQAELFHAQLETEIANLRREMEANGDQIDVLQRIVDRLQSLVKRGSVSAAQLDEDLLRLSALKTRQVQLEAALNFALLRDKATEDGIYILADGSAPDWVRYSELELRLEQNRAHYDIHETRAAHIEAQKDFEAEQRMLATLSEASVTAPVGSFVFSVVAPPLGTVAVGDRIIEWIDCANLMVDVPVSDAELPLIPIGAPAEVVLEGDSRVRSATVLLTRGSAAALGRTDLAAIAKGRVQGVAQALLTFEVDASEFDRCPVGHAAYVEFPDVGLLDIITARLRL